MTDTGATPPAGAAAPPPAPDAAPRRRFRLSRRMIALAAIALVVAAGWLVHRMLTANQEGTDDANVEADVVPIAARIGGTVLRVAVTENALVREGDLLLEIDPEPARARVRQAEAELATAIAMAEQADAQVAIVSATAPGSLHAARAGVSSAAASARSAAAQIRAARAAVERAEAETRNAQADLARAQQLFAQGAVARAELDRAQAAYDEAVASEHEARAGVGTASAAQSAQASQIGAAQGAFEQSAPVAPRIDVARAQADVAHARVTAAEAALELARIDLGYTRVVAPRDGVVSRFSTRAGQLLVTGQAIAMLVPAETYLVANFKETQIGRMRVGDRAEAEVDAFPGVTLHGRVESISGGTGSRFALLPPDNASGNFVRVVQRVPVRIVWEEPPGDLALRAGLSATVTVFVGTAGEPAQTAAR